MKIAVINFSGNVGKTTVAKHLLVPRLPGAELIAIESLNAAEGQDQALRGREFGMLQEYLQTVDTAVVDIGASNVEDLLGLMRRYRGSHEDFDYFIVPTVSAQKQQQDTIATLAELVQLGVTKPRLKLLFNMVEYGSDVSHAFGDLFTFLKYTPIAQADPACCLGANEIYARIRASEVDLTTLAADDTDYKALIARAGDASRKIELAQKLATRRLAIGVVPELDACFKALKLHAREDQHAHR